MRIAGSCHCRNVTFVLEWTPEPTEIPARACRCSFCTRHGGLWTSCPTGALTVTIADRALVCEYRFGTGTAGFHVCRRCGVVPVVTSRIDGHLYGAVNVNAFESVDAALLRRAPLCVDDEPEAVRLARRKRGWIARVTFAG